MFAAAIHNGSSRRYDSGGAVIQESTSMLVELITRSGDRENRPHNAEVCS